jgi:hypothetical protein
MRGLPVNKSRSFMLKSLNENFFGGLNLFIWGGGLISFNYYKRFDKKNFSMPVKIKKRIFK